MRFWKTSGRLIFAACACAGLATLAWTAWPSVASWHRDRLAEQLAASLETTPDGKVAVPIRQLAKLGTSAIRPLVAAAASQRASIANHAQQVLDQRYESWRIRADSDNQFQLLPRIEILADALATHIDQFGLAGKQWAEGRVLKILRDAGGLDPLQIAPLLANCSDVLAAVPPQGPRMRNLPIYSEIPLMANQQQLASPGFVADSLASSSEIFPPATLWKIELVTRFPTSASDDTNASLPSSVVPLAELPNGFRQPSGNWSPRWEGSQPKKTELRSADTVETVIDIPSPSEMQSHITQLRKLSTNQLLDQWPATDRFEGAAILAVLREQGFTTVEQTLLPRLTSTSERVRASSINDLVQLPAAAARRWLYRLLEDPSGEVRLRSLTAIATTNDPRLRELARRRAVVDDDQRVADLAAKILREKLR